MPWSEWIQSEPYGRSTVARYRAVTQSGRLDHSDADLGTAHALGRAGLYTDDATTVVHGASSAGSPTTATRAESFTSGGSPVWTGGIIQTQVLSWFDTDSIDLPGWRQWSPPELDDLTEGVDYGVRPDRTGAEDDAFIEYEDGVGELTGWTGFRSGRVEFITASQETSAHATARWRLLDPAPAVPVIPPVDGSVSAPPLVLTPSAGTPIAQIVDGVLLQTTPASITAGPSSQVAVLLVTDDTTDPVDAAGTETFVHEWGVSGVPIVMSARVRLPRWRYWIPGIPPLRQRQRDDGLGLSATPKWSGHGSKQASNRWRGYY